MGPQSKEVLVVVKMKAAYALAFLGLCAIVLLVHINREESQEEMKEVQDPFLATLEARVVARAQARLRKARRQRASKEHISAVREAIRNSLKAAAAKKHKKQVKQFTWDELQAGADAPPSPHKD